MEEYGTKDGKKTGERENESFFLTKRPQKMIKYSTNESHYCDSKCELLISM